MRKRDGSVAVRRSSDEWSEILEEWRRSRQDVAPFCEARGLKVSTFRWWRCALKDGVVEELAGAAVSRRAGQARRWVQGGQSVASTTPGFIEVIARSAAGEPDGRRDSGVEVMVSGGRAQRRVRVAAGFDEDTLRRVVRLLEEVTGAC